jgi:hypothetical protein
MIMTEILKHAIVTVMGALVGIGSQFTASDKTSAAGVFFMMGGVLEHSPRPR